MQMVIETCWGGSTHAQATVVMVIGEACTCASGGASVCDGRRWWWRWTVVAGADDGGGIHACVRPTSSSRADGGAPSSDSINCIFILKNYYSNRLSWRQQSRCYCDTIVMDLACLSLLWLHSSNGIVATDSLIIATVPPWKLLQDQLLFTSIWAKAETSKQYISLLIVNWILPIKNILQLHSSLCFAVQKCATRLPYRAYCKAPQSTT
jgi:hypothetical protein